MDAPNKENSSRMAVGRDRFRLLTVVFLAFCFGAVMICAAVLVRFPKEPISWTVLGLGLALIWYLYRRDARGRHDWNLLTYLELHDGEITFMPSRRMRWMGYSKKQAPFPAGARLEYHRETGDRYLTGDHGLSLQGSLWTIGPTEAKQKLSESTAALNIRTMVVNLANAGIPFKVINIYEGMDGKHTEEDVTASFTEVSAKAKNRGLPPILLGTSSLWLRATAGVLVHSGGYVITIGVVGYALIFILTLRSTSSKPSALVQILSTAPSYAAGYAFAVVSVWYLFKW